MIMYQMDKSSSQVSLELQSCLEFQSEFFQREFALQQIL